MSKNGYTDSYVAFIDILGFKEFIVKNKFENASNLFSTVIKSKDFALSCFNSPEHNNIVFRQDPYDMTINVISDSIVISIPKTSPISLDCLLLVSCDFAFQILKEYNLSCRGAIAEGSYFSDGNISYGPALVDAYTMESNLAVYPRIVFTPNTLESYLEKHPEAVNSRVLDREKIIFLDTRDDLFCVDYLKRAMCSISEDVHKDPSFVNNANYIFNTIQKNIEERIYKETNPHIREKYLYLASYYNLTVSSAKELLPYPIPFECNLIFEKNEIASVQHINRSNYQNYGNNVFNSNNAIHNSQNIAIGKNAKITNEVDNFEKEVLDAFKNLSFSDKAKVIKFIDKLKNKCHV